MEFYSNLHHITYNSFFPIEVFHSLQQYLANPELFRFDTFLFGYMLLDLNKALFYIYNVFIIAVCPKNISWPAIILCENIYDTLNHISWLYYFAYASSNFFLVLAYTGLFLIVSLWHFFFLLYIVKFLIIDLNLFFLFYKCIKLLFFFFVYIWINIYCFFLIILKKRVSALKWILSKQRIKSNKRWIFANIVYWSLYHAYVSLLDGWALPAGGYIVHEKNLWGYPQWMYWCKLAFHKEGIRSKIFALNLWSRLKLVHNKSLGIKEKKWWFFLASWNLIYNLRYYYYFMGFFFLAKKLRLIYFFIIFSFKFCFFKLLKYFLEFNLLCNLLEIFLWYYIQLRMHIRELIPLAFYNFLWNFYIYSKSDFSARFVLIDLHYWAYRVLIFFRPDNYGFAGSERLYKQPFDMEFNTLRNFLWYRHDKNEYNTACLLSFLKYQQIIYFCFFYFINLFLEKASIWGYNKAVDFCKGNTQINKAIIKAYFFYGYFLAQCLTYLEDLKKKQIYIYFFYLFIKFRFLKQKLFSKKFFKVFNSLYVLKFFLFLSPFFIILFFFYKFICFFFFLSKAPLSLLCLFIYKTSLNLSTFAVFFLFNKLFFYYLIFIFLFIFFVIFDSKKALQKTNLMLITIIWAASFFIFYFWNILIYLISFFLFVNRKLKLWAFFIIFLILALDFEFFYFLFLDTLTHIIFSTTSIILDFSTWAIDVTCPISDPLKEFAPFIVRTEKWYYDTLRNIDSYYEIVTNYLFLPYWKEEWSIIKNCIKEAYKDPYTWFGAFLMVILTDEVPSFEEYVKTELPTFHMLPYNVIMLLYYRFLSFYQWVTFAYPMIPVKYRTLTEIWILVNTFFFKVLFEIKWVFTVDVPFFLNLITKDGIIYYENFLNFLTDTMPSSFLNLILDYYNFIAPRIFYIVNYRLKISFEGLFANFASSIGFIEYFFSNISFSKNYDNNIWVFFFAKTQKIIQLNDIYNKGFYRSSSDILKGNLLDKHKHFDVIYQIYTSTWDEYEAPLHFESWFLNEPDIVIPGPGRWTLLRNWDSLRLYGINNLKKFCFKLGDYYSSIFFLPSSLLYRSLFFYLYFCFFSLFLMLYLFLVHIVGYKSKETKWDFLASSRTNVWSHIRNPLERKKIAWIDSFSTLGSVETEWTPYRSIFDPIERKVWTLKDWENRFFFCFHRYFRTILELSSRYRWGLKLKNKQIKKKQRGWAYCTLLSQYDRLAKKLFNYRKEYNLKPWGYVWNRPFSFRELFYKKEYKDFISIAERNQNTFKILLSHEKILTFRKIKDKVFFEEFLEDQSLTFAEGFSITHKYGCYLERLVWGSYYQRLPFNALSREDTYMVEDYLKKIFDYFYKIDQFFFKGKGSNLMIHKDPGNDTFSYNEERSVAYQIIDDPYEFNFRLDIVLWELILMVFIFWYNLEYIELIPAMEEDYDEWIYLLLWLMSFFEHFDFLHGIFRYLIYVLTQTDAMYNWDLTDCYAEEHVPEGYGIISVNIEQLMWYYFSLPDYWLREAFFVNKNFYTKGFFIYIIDKIKDIFYEHFIFISSITVVSPILFIYYIIKYILALIFIAYYLIRKFLGISLKKIKFYFYIEYSIFYLSYLRGFMRAKCKTFYYYLKKRNCK